MPRLNLQPGGHVKGGHIDYNVGADDNLTFSGVATVSIGWFSKDYPVSGNFQGNKGQWAKKAWIVPGTEASFPYGLEAHVLDSGNGQSHVEIDDTQYSLTGVATVDVSGDPETPISILQVHGQVTIHGITQEIVAVAA